MWAVVDSGAQLINSDLSRSITLASYPGLTQFSMLYTEIEKNCVRLGYEATITKSK